MADLEKMIDVAGRQLFLYPEVSETEELKRLFRRWVLKQKLPPADRFSWPNAMLADGLLAAFAFGGRQQGLLDAASYLEQWKKKKYRIRYADNVMNGSLALWISGLLGETEGDNAAEEGRKRNRGVRQACLGAQEACAAWLRRTPKTADGILPYRGHHPDWIFADTVGMVCPFLCRYGVEKREESLRRLGEAQILRFLEKGMDAESGLPYHGYDEKTGVKYGAVGWGRACGWLLKGMAESLPWLAKGLSGKDAADEAQKEAFEEILGAYRKLVWRTLACQRPDGGFSWLLPAEEGPRDSSAEGMIGAAVSMGLRCGLLKGGSGSVFASGWEDPSRGEEADPDAAERALQHLHAALEQSVDGGLVRDCSGECRGFAEYPQIYGWYPWGQGSVLAFFAAEEQRHG